MKTKKNVILTIILVTIVFISIYNINLRKNKDIYVSVITYIVSPETYDEYKELEALVWYEAFTTELEKRCNYNTEKINLILNRQWLYYYEAIEINEIILVKNINIEFIESIDNNNKTEGSITNKYKVSYTYLDKNNKAYNLIDTYLITRQDNQITNFRVLPEINTYDLKGILSMQK
ncbi:hypothetical protein J2Z76_002550 [Sedimentibacter acidaminivorans]|uniref:Uncharacterized protein n=1 Tax=Sedimentibacter acidaminivorans TaxID=913099 RepID=A0ABS4GG72_9FIRM|nr:hypothetical protein [Sedimentibacter acidaminivorans]MBP1926681.1 hypothetical protein [Sedimentibacter acidaminivorans]